MKRYRRAAVLAAALLAGVCCRHITKAEEAEEVYEIEEEYITVENDSPGMDNDELLMGYLEEAVTEVVYEDHGVGNLLAGDALQGNDRIVYDLLKKLVKDVAEAKTASATCTIPMETYGVDPQGYIAEQLGVSAIVEDGAISQAAVDAMNAMVEVDYNAVIAALTADCPYELYWYDKTVGYSYSTFGMTASTESGEWKIRLTGESQISLAAALEYAAGEFETDLSKTEAVNQAVSNAAGIVRSNRDQTDYEKVLSYCNAICDLTSYNHDAAENDPPYGNPWQLVYVFDGDESTTVVCEGYSKAFKYLCDLSSFDVPLKCVTVTGYMNGGTGEGAHMWNIVTMDDGVNYLVDVTNSDEGTAGYKNELFLCGTVKLSDTVYRADIPERQIGNLIYGSSSITYRYDDSTVGLWGNKGILDLSENPYVYNEPVDPTGEQSEGDWIYTVNNNHAYIVRYTNGERNVIVPERLSNHRVAALGSDIFANCSDVYGAVIGYGIDTIDAHAFDNSNVKDIYFAGTEEEWNDIFSGDVSEQTGIHYSVDPFVPAEGITASETEFSLTTGESVSLQAGVVPENATNRKIEWYSEDETIASVDENGMVMAKAAGDVIISAVSRDGGYKADFTIHVSLPEIYTLRIRKYGETPLKLMYADIDMTYSEIRTAFETDAYTEPSYHQVTEPDGQIVIYLEEALNGRKLAVYQEGYAACIRDMLSDEEENVIKLRRLGDVLDDERINVADLVSVRNEILRPGSLGEEDIHTADMNFDNMVNIVDLVAIRNVILGRVSE